MRSVPPPSGERRPGRVPLGGEHDKGLPKEVEGSAVNRELRVKAATLQVKEEHLRTGIMVTTKNGSGGRSAESLEVIRSDIGDFATIETSSVSTSLDEVSFGEWRNGKGLNFLDTAMALIQALGQESKLTGIFMKAPRSRSPWDLGNGKVFKGPGSPEVHTHDLLKSNLRSQASEKSEIMQIP